MGAKEHAFANADLDPFKAALEWLLAREWSEMTRAEAEKIASKVARRIEHVRQAHAPN